MDHLNVLAIHISYDLVIFNSSSLSKDGMCSGADPEYSNSRHMVKSKIQLQIHSHVPRLHPLITSL